MSNRITNINPVVISSRTAVMLLTALTILPLLLGSVALIIPVMRSPVFQSTVAAAVLVASLAASCSLPHGTQILWQK